MDGCLSTTATELFAGPEMDSVFEGPTTGSKD